MEAAVKVKRSPILMTDRFGLAEDRRHDFVADVPVGITVEDILESSYWAHVAPQMDPFDHIEARAEDGSWIAYLVVLGAERNYAKVKLDRVITIEEKVGEVPISTKHKIEWKGPFHKFSVIRISDLQSLQSGFKTRYLAETWMLNHEKGMQ